jgi:hypothetical protein
MTAMTSPSNMWGPPKLYGNRDVDRLQWFARKNLELNTKSPSLFCALQELILSAASAARAGGSTWGRGAPKSLDAKSGDRWVRHAFFAAIFWELFCFGATTIGTEIAEAGAKK